MTPARKVAAAVADIMYRDFWLVETGKWDVPGYEEWKRLKAMHEANGLPPIEANHQARLDLAERAVEVLTENFREEEN